MKRCWLQMCAWVLCLGIAAQADEVTGKVTGAGFGSFKLDDNGTIKQLNLSAKSSEYEPSSWRPTEGDTVTATYTVQTGRKGEVLAVNKVTLVKAGDNTIVSLENPVTVEIVDVGSSGIKAKLPKGQILRFTRGRRTQMEPAGWVPAAGEKAKITFKLERGGFGFGLNYVAEKIEKIGQAEEGAKAK